MNDHTGTDDPHLEEVAHLSLQLGRLLLGNGADAADVQREVERFAGALGCEVHLLVTYEALLLTTVGPGRFSTKLGSHLPGLNVNMSAVDTLNRIVADTISGRIGMADARQRLEAQEHAPPAYHRWLVIAGLGLTAASLSRLFGGDWGVFATVLVAGLAGTWVRLLLAARHGNPFLVPFATALVSGIIGGIGVRLGFGAMPALCLVAPGMILVPGVPLINGIADAIRNHMVLGLARLGFAMIVVLAIALGLFAATVATGVSIPVDETTRLLAIPEDAMFSALAALGFIFLFNVPARLCWAGVVCGICSHTLRTIGLHLGIDIVSGTLLGALAAGFLSHGFARRFLAPPAAFSFPGVVAMVPGAYAFRFVIGSLHIMQSGATAAPSLLAETASLGITSCLMTAAIAIGLAVPAAMFTHPIIASTRHRRPRA